MACTETYYIQSATTLADKLAKINQIIDALIDRQIVVVGDAQLDEYEINDGQTKIRTAYNSPEAISKAIIAYERIATYLRNKLNGRVFVLRDSRGF